MNIGLAAHDGKKQLMQNFCIAYRNILCKHELFATGTTGRLIEDATNLKVHTYLTGHLGGIEQMAADIESNQMDLVIFLRDANITRDGHDNILSDVVRLCDSNNIPVATNLGSAEIMILAMDRGDFEFRNAYK